MTSARLRATLQDVAEASGVSTATVSFVLNETPGQSISAATASRVRDAVARLGYQPHAVARALREGSSRIVLLETAGLAVGHALRSYIAGMQTELAAAGHALLILPEHVPSAGQPSDAIRPRAVVRPGSEYPDDAASAPDDWADGLAAHSFAQIDHLAELGHREIAMVLPEPPGRFGELRLRLARESARRLGIEKVAAVPLPPDRAGTTERLRRALEDHPRTTAIAAHDDETAGRALAALTDLRVRIPDDIAVIGFDDTGAGEFTLPPLTSVRIDAEEYGRRAARTALGLAASATAPATTAQVVRRAST